jgi:parallel beta-helix repeat protein
MKTSNTNNYRRNLTINLSVIILKYKKTVIAILLVVLVVLASFITYNLHVPASQTPTTPKPFYLGIETGWNSALSDCEALIDQVKSYTNLFIIASPSILSNETLLNQTCDYAYNAGLSFIPVYYQDLNNGSNIGYAPESWFTMAKERFGDKLLGIYFYDEPGGIQLDETINLKSNNIYNTTSEPNSYLDYANWYFHIWTQGEGVPVAAKLTHKLDSSLFTSDYALYWFDYKLGYDTVLAQFGWNNSRPLQISLVRGAAEAQNKTWGAIITWTYDRTPYLESGQQMYDDMVLAYNSGANYIAVYDSSQNYANTTLTQEHYKSLEQFWNYTQQNPQKHGSLKADYAMLLPQNYGFGFRSQDDSVWQYHNATSWTQKLYGDVTNLLNRYSSSLNIVYNDPEFISWIQSAYSKILYWPEDFKSGFSYPVTDLNNSLGYSTIQDAISSFATYGGDTILVKNGTYQENIVLTKPVTLISQNKDNTIIKGLDNGTAVTIAADNVTVSGFTIKNGDYSSATLGTGILLENVHNCTVTGNIITSNYIGILFENSTDNVFRNNEINGNSHNLILQNSSSNDIDASNIVDGKPYILG